MPRPAGERKKNDVSSAYIGYHVDLLDSLASAIGFMYDLYILAGDVNDTEHIARIALLLGEVSSGVQYFTFNLSFS